MNKNLYLFIAFLLLSSFGQAQTGITWNSGMNINSASGNNHPRIAVDGSGNPLVVWNHNNNAMFTRWDGNAFTMPMPVNPMNITVAGAAWMGPDIASYGDTVYVVFKQTPENSDTCHIFCTHSYDGGVNFSAPVQVDDIADSISRFPTVTTDDLGNPIVAFMKFDATFSDSRWAVSRSTDFGFSFSIDTKASGWSSASSLICDCCPGALACSGNTVAMVYRDNDNNNRDSWAGISTDGGYTFSYGMPIDQNNWNIFSCPSTGGDAVIIGDSLYSVYMNGASGTSLVYMNASSISEMNGSQGIALAGSVPGLSLQNYPRIASDGTAMAVVWKQVVSGNDQCVIRFTNDITNGLPMQYDTVDLSNVTNADVAVYGGKVFVIWQDDGSNTIKIRTGSFNSTTGVQETAVSVSLSVFPNPASSEVQITSKQVMDEVVITNALGQIVYHDLPGAKKISVNLNIAGIYFVTVRSNNVIAAQKLTVLH